MKLPLIMATALCVSATALCAEQVPSPVDKPYLGVIDLQVDASNVAQKIVKVHERIPVRPGPLTLLYPQWQLGAHAPADGSLSKLAGMMLHADQQRIEWKRDPVNVYAFHATVPAGVSYVEADFDFLSPLEGSEGSILMTPEMLAVHWESLLLYPAGYFARDITVRPIVKFPENWQFAGALEVTAQSGTGAQFKAVNLEELIDSPLYAGRNFKRIDLDPGAKVPVFLNLVADGAESLEASPQQIDAHRALVRQAYQLFGSHHYDHYDLLFAISDEMSHIGLEHQRSSENRSEEHTSELQSP